MSSYAGAYEGADWALNFGGQNDCTVPRCLGCICHKDCPARVRYVREAVGSEWVLSVGPEPQAQTPRERYEGKGLRAEFKDEIDAMLQQGKGPEYTYTALATTYGPNGLKSNLGKFSRVPTKSKIKAYKGTTSSKFWTLQRLRTNSTRELMVTRMRPRGVGQGSCRAGVCQEVRGNWHLSVSGIPGVMPTQNGIEAGHKVSGTSSSTPAQARTASAT
ncbi:hypothetical protein T492DRAFT_232317 [Pavlovales sp. CCMP2436]|nr:hypothetical protein T492DRAFT_232317 [Pavlovales sp. CCMP2436]